MHLLKGSVREDSRRLANPKSEQGYNYEKQQTACIFKMLGLVKEIVFGPLEGLFIE